MRITKNYHKALDEQYYEQLKKIKTGYKGIKLTEYIQHLDMHWCHLNTSVIKEMKTHYIQGWQQVSKHITEFGQRLDKEQDELRENNITIALEDKL